MRILLVEDDDKLRDSLSFQLKKEGFQIDTAADGEEALYFIRLGIHDLILLDRMLPLLDGTEVLKTVRREEIETPVIFITALGELGDKVEGLDLGADDYLVKPFAFEELMARIRCIFRRPRALSDIRELEAGDLRLSPADKQLFGPGGSCTLSSRESELLETFLRNPGQTLSRTLLLTKVWGMDSDVEDGNLDNYIHFLRRRLNHLNSAAKLQTLRGVGYRLNL